MNLVVYSKHPSFARHLLENLEIGVNVLSFCDLGMAREMSKYCDPAEIILDIHSISKADIEALSVWPKNLINRTIMASEQTVNKSEIIDIGIYRLDATNLIKHQITMHRGIFV